jgi:MoxR-like ATPase
LNKLLAIIKASEQILNGKEEQVKLALCAVLSGGHVLIEDVPGVGKTTLVKMLGRALGLRVNRIQFTNDILPSDIIGTSIYSKETGQFNFMPGPIFGEIILADELNRAPAKTQSALLQAMEEKYITIDGQTHKLSEHFTVFATQNPQSQIGTYELPESQLDRFTIKFSLGYPNRMESLAMLKTKSLTQDSINMPAMISPNEIQAARTQIEKIHMSDDLYDYIYDLLHYSRGHHQYVDLSNRCGLDLVKTAKAWAYLNQRDFVICDDIQYLFPFVAAHRLTHQSNMNLIEQHDNARQIIAHVPVRK